MDRIKLLTVAVVGLLLLNGLTIGFLLLHPGQPPRPVRAGPGGGDGPGRIISERLHFDARQEEQYQQLISAHRQQSRELADESVRLHHDYYDLLTANQPDTGRANALSRQIGDNQRALAQLNFAHFRQIKALCRPDQQADFVRLVDDLSRLFGRSPRPERPGPDRPPGGGPENGPPRP